MAGQQTLAQLVRAKYPGAYDDMSDDELESAVDAKYPGAYTDVPRSRWMAENMPAESRVTDQPAPQPSPRDEVMAWGREFSRRLVPGPMGSAPVDISAKAVPGIVETGRRILGISSQRAGQNLDAVRQAAQNVTVNAGKTGEAGLRAMELQAAGGRMPRAATQLLRRVTDPGGPDLTFAEARDFYSNLSRLSANETGTLNPVMQRQITAMRQALHEALVESADTVGRGAQYQRGMSEYANAARRAEQWEKAKPAVMRTLRGMAKWAAGGAGLYGASRYGSGQ